VLHAAAAAGGIPGRVVGLFDSTALRHIFLAATTVVITSQPPHPASSQRSFVSFSVTKSLRSSTADQLEAFTLYLLHTLQ